MGLGYRILVKYISPQKSRTIFVIVVLYVKNNRGTIVGHVGTSQYVLVSVLCLGILHECTCKDHVACEVLLNVSEVSPFAFVAFTFLVNSFLCLALNMCCGSYVYVEVNYNGSV